ncbi:MAG: hypothetical protein FJ295_19060 [Planctomycetes bacterium]|nr:hypothetical protein [Planctomycetota bacterium]
MRYSASMAVGMAIGLILVGRLSADGPGPGGAPGLSKALKGSAGRVPAGARSSSGKWTQSMSKRGTDVPRANQGMARSADAMRGVRRGPSTAGQRPDPLPRMDGIPKPPPELPDDRISGRDASILRQREVAQRNLEHRQQQAEHLHGISERNGNERLRESGERMEKRARQQFESRDDRISSIENRLVERSSDRKENRVEDNPLRIEPRPLREDPRSERGPKPKPRDEIRARSRNIEPPASEIRSRRDDSLPAAEETLPTLAGPNEQP